MGRGRERNIVRADGGSPIEDLVHGIDFASDNLRNRRVNHRRLRTIEVSPRRISPPGICFSRAMAQNSSSSSSARSIFPSPHVTAALVAPVSKAKNFAIRGLAAVSMQRSEIRRFAPCGLAEFQNYQEGEGDWSGEVDAGGAERLFSSPLCSRFCIAFSNSFW